jgi:hypothetical protein
VIESPIDHARRINRTWIVHGNLAEDTERYLADLERRHPEILREVCERAVTSTRAASKEQRDPKPDFYAELFRHATGEELAYYLKDHPWTRQQLARLRPGGVSCNGDSAGDFF